MEDALRVEDYKRMTSQLENSIRRKCGYIAALKSRSNGEGVGAVVDKRKYDLAIFEIQTAINWLPELARAAGSDVTKDQLVLLFEREIAESVGKIKEYRKLCIELRANMRLRNDYISKLRLYRSCDDVLGSIAMLRTMQSDDSENAARLLSLARETQRKVDEKTAFIKRIRERTLRKAL
ncbi:hypothetical protein Tco_0105001 [Tanacetum coccineum]